MFIFVYVCSLSVRKQMRTESICHEGDTKGEAVAEAHLQALHDAHVHGVHDEVPVAHDGVGLDVQRRHSADAAQHLCGEPPYTDECKQRTKVKCAGGSNLKNRLSGAALGNESI